MTLFYHFASIVGCRCEFYVGTLHCNLVHYKFWPYLSFLLEQQITLLLKSLSNINYEENKTKIEGDRTNFVGVANVYLSCFVLFRSSNKKAVSQLQSFKENSFPLFNVGVVYLRIGTLRNGNGNGDGDVKMM